MRAHIAQRANRLRSSSLNAVPPPLTSSDYSLPLAKVAASILYRTPIPSRDNLPIYILNAAAFPDTNEFDYDDLLPYVLARLPGEDELISGTEYEVIFFAGGGDGSATGGGGKKNRPGWGWFLQAYHVLSRAMRKRLQKLYIVHERNWVRILVEMFSTIVSPKFRRKIVHVSTLTQLALHIPIEDLLIPPSAYLHDRRLSPDIHAPYASGRRAFSVRQPFPENAKGETRLPRVLRETTSFLLLEPNIKTEGLFRIPPHSRLKEVLREAYDRGQKFILWKENDVMLPIPAYRGAEATQAIIDEVDSKDSYGVYLAAGLIKTWYAELRQPLFPQSAYRELRSNFGDIDDPPTLERLTDLISPKSEWSAIPVISRAIMIRHLLPMLSIVAMREEDNKMSPDNLAVCFAPTLVCGPDQLEDAKMSSIIRRILAAAIEEWDEGLREACEVDENTFAHELMPPSNYEDYEDPLEAPPRATSSHSSGLAMSPTSATEAGFADSEKQFSGITLEDNEAPEQAPALPPRPSSGRTPSRSSIPRKPAPPVIIPPRYSAVMGDDAGSSAAAATTESPLNYAATADGFAPPRKSEWSVDEKQKDGDKSGSGTAGSSSLPSIIVPKRKALTAVQIGNAESGGAVVSPTAEINIATAAAEAARRRPSASEDSQFYSAPSSQPMSREASSGKSSPSSTSPAVLSPQLSGPEHRRPSEYAPRTTRTSRTPTITSLARPLYPSNSPHLVTPAGSTYPPPLPQGTPKPRGMSQGLLRRMPSFEPPPIPNDDRGRRKLDLKKKSVEDLRRLYEGRAGTGAETVGGRERGRSVGANARKSGL
ncbi:hypothetical protein K490DRAFT_45374 [Saccharata proteae CBS 121410]|uniref:Rho GTPase activation protein n=1 Tax=Saccharata proteae CBS 121410 TaxID=1314787 RepID=A0A9P4HU19_9PEZI|nr:hypothetical protein K490DRAFT_45374 [Saccharata proteae CBS 121410]